MKHKHLTLGLLIASSLFTHTAVAGCGSPVISVGKTCALASDGDKNGNGKIDPGDILECTVTITNYGDFYDHLTAVTDTSEDLEFQNDNQYIGSDSGEASIGVEIIDPNPSQPN